MRRRTKIALPMSLTALVPLLTACDPNAEPTYGTTGLPKNCRAIIAENVSGWRSGIYTADEAMASIERNCGEDGYSWDD